MDSARGLGSRRDNGRLPENQRAHRDQREGRHRRGQRLGPAMARGMFLVRRLRRFFQGHNRSPQEPIVSANDSQASAISA